MPAWIREGAKTPLYAPVHGAASPVATARRRPNPGVKVTRMARLGDAPLVGAGSDLELTVEDHLVAPADGLIGRDGERVGFR
jgi:hypothetical protein